MKKMTDKIRAQRMLEMRESGGYRVLPFLRMNAKMYVILAIYFLIALAFLAFSNAWVAFGYLAFFVIGMLLRDVSWFIGLRRGWPFLSRIANWDEVKNIANDTLPNETLHSTPR